LAPDCRICELQLHPPEGGWYWQDEHWSIGPHLTTEVPGWTVVYLRRHASSLSAMTQPELESMGPTLAMAAAAVEAEAGAERVYLVLFGENFPHLHLVLIPRGAGVPPEHRSSRLHVHAKEYVDPVAYREVGERIRRRLAAAPRR